MAANVCQNPSTFYMYGFFVNGKTTDTGPADGVPIQAIKTLLTGETVYMYDFVDSGSGQRMTRMVASNGIPKYYWGSKEDFNPYLWLSYSSPATHPYMVGPAMQVSGCNRSAITPIPASPYTCWLPLYYIWEGSDTGTGFGVKKIDVLPAPSNEKIFIADDLIRQVTLILTENGEIRYMTGTNIDNFNKNNWASYPLTTSNPANFSPRFGLGPSAFAAACKGQPKPTTDRVTATIIPSKRYYLYGQDITGNATDTGDGIYVSSIKTLPTGETVFLCEDYAANGFATTKMVTNTGVAKYYSGLASSFNPTSWSTYSASPTTNGYKLGVRWSNFDQAELQLRFFMDPMLRSKLALDTQIETVHYDIAAGRIIYFFRILSGTWKIFGSIPYPPTNSTIVSTDYSVRDINIPPVRGYYVYKGQRYLLLDTAFARLSALGQIEQLAAPNGQNPVALVQLRDMCFNPTEECFYFTDSGGNAVYRIALDNTVDIVCKIADGKQNIALRYEDGEVSSDAVYIASPYGITISADGTLYVTSSTFNQVYALKKTYKTSGEIHYMISVVAGLSAAPGAIRNGETSKYSKVNAPQLIRCGTDGALYFMNQKADGTYGIAKITPPQYNTYYKGFTGAIQYAPIQVIGNNTTEGNIQTTTANANAISSEFFAMHMVTDEEGNLYYADPKAGVVYKMDLNNQITTLVSIPGAYALALYNNSYMYVSTESASDSQLYGFALNNTAVVTQFPGVFGGIRALCAKESGVLFLGSVRNSPMILYKNISFDFIPYILFVTPTSLVQFDKYGYTFSNTDVINYLKSKLAGRTYGPVGYMDCRFTWPSWYAGDRYTLYFADSDARLNNPMYVTFTKSNTNMVDPLPPINSERDLYFTFFSGGGQYFSSTILDNIPIQKEVAVKTIRKSDPIYTLLKNTYNSILYFIHNSIQYKITLLSDVGLYNRPTEYITLQKYDKNTNAWINSDTSVFPDNTEIQIYIQNDLPLLTLPTGAVPNAMCLDDNDNLYITTDDNRVQKIAITETPTTVQNPTGTQSAIMLASISGTRTIFAGDGTATYKGDGGLATAAGIGRPFGITYSKDEKFIYLTTYETTARIRRIDIATNRITTFMGLQRSGYPVHGAVPSASTLLSPAGICRDLQGNLFLMDALERTDLLSRSTTLIKIPSKFFFLQDYVYPLVGTGLEATAPESGLALSCKFKNIQGIAADFYGNIFFTTSLHTVHRYDALTEQVVLIAGTGVPGFSGDGGPATAATLSNPTFIQVTTAGAIYVVDEANKRIRRITALANGGYMINTFVQTTGVISGLAVDVFETVIYSNNVTNMIQLTNQYGSTTNLTPGSRVGGVATFGRTLYYLNRDTGHIHSYLYPYTTPTQFTTIPLANPAGPITVDSQGNLYYVTFDSQIRKVSATEDSPYIGQAGVQDFYDGVLSTAGIKDNRHRGDTLLNQPIAVALDYFSRLLFSDQKGNRIRCVPTGLQLNECYVAAAYIAIESAAPGKQFQFSQFDIFTNTSGSTPVKSNPVTTPMTNLLIDLTPSVNIGYIQCKSTSIDTIGAKIYLLNSNRDILSVRVLTNTCTSKTGENLIYAVPWATSCPISNFVNINRDCGITGVNAIRFSKDGDTNNDFIRQFNTFVLITREYISLTKQYIVKGEYIIPQSIPILYGTQKEVLGLFMFRSYIATSDGIRSVKIRLFSSATAAGTPLIEKVITNPSNTNLLYEFIDFRKVIADFGCSSLDMIYQVGLGMYRVRYIRVLKPAGADALEVGEVVAISLESGYNVALGRPAYTATASYQQITTGVNTKLTGFTSTSDNWIEVDLGIATPLEFVTIYPPTGKSYAYTVQCFTETRDLIPTPTYDQNPFDTRVSKIRVQGSGYTANYLLGSYLQTSGIRIQPTGGSFITPIGSFNAYTYWEGLSAQNFIDSGRYHSLFITQREFFEFTLNTPQALAAFQFVNRSDGWQKRQYGNQVLFYNSTGRLLQRNCLMGLNTGDKTEQISLNFPNAITFHFPSSRRGIANVRYVRIKKSASSNKLQIAQLVVYNTYGQNVALNRPATYRSLETGQIYTIAIVNVQNIWKQNDFTTLINTFGADLYNAKHFYFLYQTKLFRGRLNPNENAFLQKMTLEIFTAGRWQVPTGTDIPMNTVTAMPISITILNPTDDVLIAPQAPTDGSQIPSASKLYRSAGTGADEYYQIDLGSPQEIDYIVYYNSTINPSSSSEITIDLLDESNPPRLLTSRALKGGLLRESVDFRADAENCLRARYIRIENPGFLNTAATPTFNTLGNISNNLGLKLSNVRILDINKRNVTQGKVVNAFNIDSGPVTNDSIYSPITSITNTYTTSYMPGSYWEIDLGQEYSLKEFLFRGDYAQKDSYLNAPITFYDDEHTQVKRFFLNKMNINNDFRIQLDRSPYLYGDPALSGLNTAVDYSNVSISTNYVGRYVHIDCGLSSNFELHQVVVLDTSYTNISLGKPIRSTRETNNAFAHFAVDGICNNKYSTATFYSNQDKNIPAYWEIDLGALYPIGAILLYGAQNIKGVYIFNETRGTKDTGQGPIWANTETITTKQALKVYQIGNSTGALSRPLPLPKLGLGQKARYVRLFKPGTAQQGFFLSQVVVTDSTGRNVALNKVPRVNTLPIVTGGPEKLTNGSYTSSEGNFYHPSGSYNSGWNYTSELYIDIDLGDEYWIVDITVHVSKYSLAAFGSWARDIHIELRDTYQILVGTQFVTNARLDDFTLLMSTARFIADLVCPAGSVEIGPTTCLKYCGPGEWEYSGRCYTPCTGVNSKVNPNDYTKCLQCSVNSSFTDSDSKCLENCELTSGYRNFNSTKCIQKCQDNDTEGRAFDEFIFETFGFGICRTRNTFTSGVMLNVIDSRETTRNNLFQIWADKDYTPSIFKLFGITNTVDNTEIYPQFEYELKRLGKAYKIYQNNIYMKDRSSGIPTSTDRPNYARIQVPKQTANTAAPFDYELITITQIINGSQQTFPIIHQVYYDWNTTNDSDFKRDSGNPAYIKGRFLAQTFAVRPVAAASTIIVPLQIPVATTMKCPTGTEFDSTAPDLTRPCKASNPGGYDIIGNNYYSRCPSGYTTSSSNSNKCFKNCNTYGNMYSTMSSDDTKCSDIGLSDEVVYEINSNKYATNCKLQRDQNNKEMKTDTGNLPNYCVTKPPLGCGNCQKTMLTRDWYSSGINQMGRFFWIDINWTPFYSKYNEIGAWINDWYVDYIAIGDNSTGQALYEVYIKNLVDDNLLDAFWTKKENGDFQELFYKERVIRDKRSDIYRDTLDRTIVPITYSPVV